MMIRRYAVVVDWNARRGTPELHTTNLPYKRAVALAKQLAGRDVRCLRYPCYDFATGRHQRWRSGTTVYAGDKGWVMVEALAPQCVAVAG